jgi:hypothetical protein
MRDLHVPKTLRSMPYSTSAFSFAKKCTDVTSQTLPPVVSPAVLFHSANASSARSALHVASRSCLLAGSSWPSSVTRPVPEYTAMQHTRPTTHVSQKGESIRSKIRRPRWCVLRNHSECIRTPYIPIDYVPRMHARFSSQSNGEESHIAGHDVRRSAHSTCDILLISFCTIYAVPKSSRM